MFAQTRRHRAHSIYNCALTGSEPTIKPSFDTPRRVRYATRQDRGHYPEPSHYGQFRFNACFLSRRCTAFILPPLPF